MCAWYELSIDQANDSYGEEETIEPTAEPAPEGPVSFAGTRGKANRKVKNIVVLDSRRLLVTPLKEPKCGGRGDDGGVTYDKVDNPFYPLPKWLGNASSKGNSRWNAMLYPANRQRGV